MTGASRNKTAFMLKEIAKGISRSTEIKSFGYSEASARFYSLF